MARPKNPHRGPPKNKKITQPMIDLAEFLKSRGYRDGAVKHALRTNFDPTLSASTCNRVIRKAQDQQLKLLDKTQDELRLEMYRVLESFIRDKNASPREKIAAIREINDLLGLKGPLKTKPTEGQDFKMRFRPVSLPGMPKSPDDASGEAIEILPTPAPAVLPAITPTVPDAPKTGAA